MSIRFASFASIVVASSAALYACAAPSSQTREAVGSALATITQVPPQVACIEVRAAGVSARFDVTPGQSSKLAMGGLPTGSVTFTALAYPVACSVLNAGTTATWASDPVTTTLIGGTTADDVSLVLHRQGRVDVGVNFDDDGGAIAPSAITLSESVIEFRVFCKDTARVDREIRITNATAQPMTLSATMAGLHVGSLSLVNPSLLPGGTASLGFSALPSGDASLGQVTDAITILTDAPGDTPHVIPVLETFSGAVLRFDGAPAPIALGQTATLTLRNDGDLPAEVELASSNGAFTVSETAPTVILPGGAIAVHVTNATASGANARATIQTMVSSWNESTHVCGALPSIDVTD